MRGKAAEMCSHTDDYHITVPPLYENLDDEKYQPFPPPLSPVVASTSHWACSASSSQTLDCHQCRADRTGCSFLSHMEEEPVMQREVVHGALDMERLVSENGIPALWKTLCKTSFKGQGNEAEDLNILLSEIQQWGQQLYSEQSFETLISQLEDVSDHPAVKTCIQDLLQSSTLPVCSLSLPDHNEDICVANMSFLHNCERKLKIDQDNTGAESEDAVKIIR